MALKHIKGLSDTIISLIMEKRGTISGIFKEKADFFYGSNIHFFTRTALFCAYSAQTAAACPALRRRAPRLSPS